MARIEKVSLKGPLVVELRNEEKVRNSNASGELGGTITGEEAEGIFRVHVNQPHDRRNEQSRLDKKEVETGVEICM